ncbi:MAG: DUF4080 domain-containing protein [Pseudomonadota bacterium]|nr:DUF4080 domain-containing protein [Pseudomonadota bacterium]
MDIVLATFNAKYIHAAFGLRYLYANLGELQPRTVLVEMDAGVAPLDAVEALLAHEPRVIGLGVYIWNATLMLAVVELLKALRPDIAIVLGGPEVSHEIDAQPLCALADVVVVGEADLAFAQVCTRLLAGEPVDHVVRAALPELTTLRLPYDHYTDEDLARRVVYVEASRGCPFLCAFCLSALDKSVRRFDEDAFVAALGALHDRGLRNFKFVDRTFNLSIASCKRILGFFLERLDPDLFVHFELIPDRLPTELKALIAAFPPGTLQFEIGIQTFDAEVAARIDRRHDPAQIEANLTWLRANTGVHLHTDLIVGLPGESVTQFAAGFDRLFALDPQEIQVGILKRLRGAPIARHTGPWGMIYSPRPPYEVLETGAIRFPELQAMKRFARFWSVLANSGHYRHTLPLLMGGESAFARFLALSEALGGRFGRSHGIASGRLVEAVYDHGIGAGIAPESLGRALIDDLLNTGRLPIPDFLRPFATEEERAIRKARVAPKDGHARQEAHGSRGAPA